MKTKPGLPDRAIVRDGRVTWPERYPDGKVMHPGDRRGASELAGEVRLHMPPQLYVAWLIEVRDGRDPAVTLDERGQKKPEPLPGFVPPDWQTRKWAAQELADRGYGKAKQEIILEGDLNVTGAVAHAVAHLDARDYGALPEADRKTMIAIQEKLIAARRASRSE